ncbi:hypothetical protein KR018_011582 [Drosophila ironensis]|nr:hypothetical protein KR018_011582 [Drosophila ironensis]
MAAALPENAAEIAVANAINNINININGFGNANANGNNGNNRVLGGVGVGMGNNMMNMRDRLFHTIYFRAAAAYAALVPRKVQLTIEFLLLAKALLFFFTLIYVHNAFIKHPCTCLQDVQNWPREGVIRVEIIPHLAEKRAIWQGIKRDRHLVRSLKDSYYYGIGPQTLTNHERLRRYESILGRLGLPVRPTFAYSNESLYYYFDALNLLDTYEHPHAIQLKGEEDDGGLSLVMRAHQLNNPTYFTPTEEQYIVEYSLEYGHLRLSSATRKRLQIPVLTVQLDPNTNKCFGDGLTRYLLKRLLGYDDLLMASVRTIAEQEENKGYLRNVITGEHYRFVSMWWAAWSSYPAAFCVMLLFTFSVSMLLRYAHHQIFVFIVDLMQMLEYNVSARFPIAPLLTVILALVGMSLNRAAQLICTSINTLFLLISLVGMEAIMSEFFNDTSTAFYIILIVWIADQYDAICCHTSITKRHWLRFFYLYHFAFYAYHYRFSGQYRTLALLSSYLFTQHSMVFFFHHYELPAIMAQHQVFIITRNQGAGAAAGAAAAAGAGAGAAAAAAAAEGRPAAADGAAGAGAGLAAFGQQAAMQRARLIVTRLFSQLAAQRQQQPHHHEPPRQGDAGHRPTAAVGGALANLRRLPIVGQWLQGREQFATVRRVFLRHGDGGNGRLMQVHLQRINVADISGLRDQVAAAVAAAGAAQRVAGVQGGEPASGATAATAGGASNPASPAADVETNQEAAMGINDAATGVGVGPAAEATQDELRKEPKQEREQEQEQQQEQELGPGPGVSKLLENLNSVAADIINMSDKSSDAATATAAPSELGATQQQQQQQPTTLIHTHAGVQIPDGSQPKARQLENNLPEKAATVATAASGEKQSCPLQASSIMNDQEEQRRPRQHEQQKNKPDEAATVATTSTAATSKQTSEAAAAAAAAAGAGAGGEVVAEAVRPMMDDRQAVDFIEGDSPTSAANCQLNAGTNHKAQEQHPQEHQQLMKTSQHTSNQVTTTAAATATAAAAAAAE